VIAELAWGQVVNDLLSMLDQPYLRKNFANHVVRMLLDIVKEPKTRVSF
jgi:hypothetical protein